MFPTDCAIAPILLIKNKYKFSMKGKKIYIHTYIYSFRLVCERKYAKKSINKQKITSKSIDVEIVLNLKFYN